MKANRKLSRVIGLICALSLCLVFAMTGCVKVVPAEGITLDRSELSIGVGKSAKLRATVTPDDVFDSRVYWYSANEDVATVDSHGKVTGVATGTTEVSAETSDGRYVAKCTVLVLESGAIWDGETPSAQPDGFVTPDEGAAEADRNLIVIESAEGLAYFAKLVNEGNTFAGKTVRLACDLDLNNRDWTPIAATVVGYTGSSFCGTFDGQNHTIYNLKTAAARATNSDLYAADGLFGTLAGTVKNVTLEKATVTGTHYAGGIAGYVSDKTGTLHVTIENCHVKNSVLTSVPATIDGSYDNGDKVGGIIGYTTGCTVTGCTVTDTTIKGYRDLGGIVGCGELAVTKVTDCSATGVTVTADQTVNSYGDKAVNAGEIIGRVTGDVVVENCTAAEAKIIAYVVGAKGLASALTADVANMKIVLADDITVAIGTLGAAVVGSGQYRLGGASTAEMAIDLNEHKLTLSTNYWSGLGAKNADAAIKVYNGSLNSSQTSGTWNSYDLTFFDCAWTFEDVTFDKAVAISTGADVTMKDCVINESNDYYALWITSEGQTVTLENVSINVPAGRAIAVKDEYVGTPVSVTLNMKDCKIVSKKKAAVLVTSEGGATVNAENVDISGVAADSVNLVWKDKGKKSNGFVYADATVTVVGGSVIVEP